MITAKYLIDETCPECGASLQALTICNLHTGGEWNEAVRYQCGRQDSYTPNLQVITHIEPCRRSEAGKALERRNGLIRALRDMDWSKFPSEKLETVVEAVKKRSPLGDDQTLL